MKKILATALAGTLLAGAPAIAQPWGGHGHVRYDRGYHHGNAGAAIGLGLGLLALTAIIASSQERRYDRAYAPPPNRYGPGDYYGR